MFVDIEVCCNALPIASATLMNLLELCEYQIDWEVWRVRSEEDLQ
jgi:hypothetical protein